MEEESMNAKQRRKYFKETLAVFKEAMPDSINKELLDNLVDASKENKKLTAEIESLRAKLAEADMDAKRYRWLRRALYANDVDIGEAYITMKVIGACPSVEDFDRAMKEQP